MSDNKIDYDNLEVEEIADLEAEASRVDGPLDPVEPEVEVEVPSQPRFVTTESKNSVRTERPDGSTVVVRK